MLLGPFLATDKALIDMEIGELSLKFIRKRCCLMCMNGHRM